MTRKWLYTIALVTILGAVLAPSLNAQESWTSPEEFRTDYLTFIDTLSARIPESDQSTWAVELRRKIADLRRQVSTLSSPALERLEAAHYRPEFAFMLDKLTAGPNTAAGLGRHGVRQALGVIQPPDFSGAVAGTTCSTTPTDASTLDGEKIGLYVDKGLQVPLDYACETIVEILGEGTNAPFCVAAAIAKAVEVVLDSLIDHQEFCNSLLDGAKADAVLNDVVDIHGDVDALDTHLTNVNNQITTEFSALDTHITNVDNHIAAEFTALDAHIVTLFGQLSTQLTNATRLLSADLKQVMKLELEPEGLRQIVPAILTCTGADCPDVLAQCTGTGGVCAWNRVGPLP
jgi:hypothetical protein